METKLLLKIIENILKGIFKFFLKYFAYLFILPILIFIAYHLLVIVVTIIANTPINILLYIGSFLGMPSTFNYGIDGIEGFKIISFWLLKIYFISNFILMMLVYIIKWLYKKNAKKELKIEHWQKFKYIVIATTGMMFINQVIFFASGTADKGYLILDIIWLIFTNIFIFIYDFLNKLSDGIIIGFDNLSDDKIIKN